MRIEVIGMGAEMTATMVVWPKQCGHGGTVLELVEHHRPYWLGRRAGRRVSAPVPARGYTLSTGLALSRPAAAAAAIIMMIAIEARMPPHSDTVPVFQVRAYELEDPAGQPAA